MFGIKKKSKEINLEKGKEIFFKYYGSRFGIGRDVGPEYDDCNISKEVEQEWLLEIITTLKNQINVSIGNEKFGYLVRLVQINELRDNVSLICNILKENNLDTFIRILLCELLQTEKKHIQDSASYDKKKYEQNFSLISEIDTTVRSYAQKLLSTPITIDESFKTARHMKDYDFSEENIKNRIKNLY